MEIVSTIAIALFLSRGPCASGDRLVVTTSRTITILAIENIPVCIQAICKAEPDVSIDDDIIGVGAIIVVGHLNTLAGIPALSKGRGTDKVHCRVSIQANERNQH